MSVSIITSFDITGFARSGTLVSCVDTGSDMGLFINGTFVDVRDTPVVVPVTIISVLTTPNSWAGCSGTYTAGGDVDWNGLITEIPSIAQINKVNITAQADYSLSSSATANAGLGTTQNVVTAGAQVFLSISCPDMLNSAPTTQTNISAFTSSTTPSPTQNTTETASVSNPGVILRKEWNFAADLGNYPLGYITHAQLLAWFTRQQLLISATEAYTAARVNNMTAADSVHTDVNGSILVRSVNWLMEVSFEVAYQWTLENNSPIQAGDRVNLSSPAIDGIDWTQVTSVTLVSPSGSITVPPVNWITITLTLFTFIVPTLTGSPGIVQIVITSTQFSGSVILGKLATIFLINATGLYQLEIGKTNDTMYDNDNGGAAVDVAIPTPYGDTGLIGG